MPEQAAASFLRSPGNLCRLLCVLAAVKLANASSPSTKANTAAFPDGEVKSRGFEREFVAARPRAADDDVTLTKRSDDVSSLEQLVQQQAGVILHMQSQLTALANDVTDLKNKAAKAG